MFFVRGWCSLLVVCVLCYGLMFFFRGGCHLLGVGVLW